MAYKGYTIKHLENTRNYREKTKKPCPMCGKLIHKTSTYCRICYHKTDSYLTKFRETCAKNVKTNSCVDCGAKIKNTSIRCVKCSKYGMLNNQWKGGTTIVKERIRGIFEYRQWRSDVFTRDNFYCKNCFKACNKLQAHHIIPMNVLIQKYEITSITDAINCDEMWNINNGITLCIDCHRELHKKEGYKNE